MAAKVNFKLVTSTPTHFGLAFLPHHFFSQPSPFHYELGALIADPHPKVAIAAPRGHAKSTIACLSEPIRACLLSAENLYTVAIISATSTFSGTWLRKIADEIMGNELLKSLWSIKPVTPWKESDEINFLVNGKRRTIRALGAGCQYRGSHDSLVVIDDLEDLENVRSETQRSYLDDWFTQTVIGSLRASSKLREIGTLIHSYCHLAMLVGNPKVGRGPRPGWKTKIYRAVEGDIADPNCKVLWPEQATREFLLSQQYEMGKIRFAREMQNDPLPDEAVVFREEWFRSKRYSVPPPLHQMSICMFLDPNSGEKKKGGGEGDYAAITVAGVVKRGQPTEKFRAGDIFILDVARGRWDFLHILEQCYELYRRFKVTTFFYEGTQFQAVIGQAFSQYCSERGLYPAVIKMDAIGSKEARARSVSDLCEQGRVWLPESTPLHFSQELFSFPVVDHDDQTDSFVGALRGIRQFSELWGEQKFELPDENKVALSDENKGLYPIVEELRKNSKEYSWTNDGRLLYNGERRPDFSACKADLESV